MRLVLQGLLLLGAVVVYGMLMPNVWLSREQVRSEVPAGYIIPSKFSRILAFGHQGLLSDFLYLKTATFIGGRSTSGTQFNSEDWDFVVRSLDVITDLDPYFLDPYFLGEGLLAWDAGMPEEANRLLYKGLKVRPSDWRLHFFVGFNYFYFLQDYERASDYIMAAARLPGSPGYLPTLGARLAYYGGKSKTALLFLKQMLAETDDALMKSRLEMRLLALEGAVAIEEAITVFKDRFGRPPKKGELVSSGALAEMPKDPYGGEWVISKGGRVYSTSKFAK